MLIAHRGEIAIRVARSAAEMGIATVAIYAQDDRRALHTRVADEAVALTGSGPAAYLDAAQIVACAVAAGCDAVHPGDGFLSENAAFARACAEAGLGFVGPRAETLDPFGDKAAARCFAQDCAVPVVEGTAGPTTLDQARAFLAGFGAGRAVMVNRSPAAAGAACASSAMRRSSLPRSSAAPPRRCKRSATATSTSSACCRVPAMSRCSSRTASWR